jgi:hypothetical protein
MDRVFIEGGIEHWTAAGELLVFVTLTEDTNARSFADSGAALTRFTRDLSRVAVGKIRGLPWVGVGELHRGSSIHWHLVVAGLCYPWDPATSSVFPDGLKSGDVAEVMGRSGVVVSKERTLKPLVAKWGFGSGFKGLRQVGLSANDHAGVGAYLSKYLAKGDAGADLPKGFQLVRSSRGRNAWWPGNSLVSVRQDYEVQLCERRERQGREAAKRTLDGSGAEPSLTLVEGGA